jgi:hypothetical protein
LQESALRYVEAEFGSVDRTATAVQSKHQTVYIPQFKKLEADKGDELVQSLRRHCYKSNDMVVLRRGRTCPARRHDNMVAKKPQMNDADLILRSITINAIRPLRLMPRIEVNSRSLSPKMYSRWAILVLIDPLRALVYVKCAEVLHKTQALCDRFQGQFLEQSCPHRAAIEVDVFPQASIASLFSGSTK